MSGLPWATAAAGLSWAKATVTDTRRQIRSVRIGSSSHQIRNTGRKVPTGGVRGAVLLLFQSDDYFPPSVPFFQIPDCLRHFTQPVTPVDNRRHFTSLHEISQDAQVLFPRLRHKRGELLAQQG